MKPLTKQERIEKCKSHYAGSVDISDPPEASEAGDETTSPRASDIRPFIQIGEAAELVLSKIIKARSKQ